MTGFGRLRCVVLFYTRKKHADGNAQGAGCAQTSSPRMNASASTSVLDAPRSMVQAPSIAPATTRPNASTHVKGYATPSTVVRKTKKPSGAGSKRLPGPLKSSRLCADESCKTVLTPGWRWRRCQTCRGGGVKRTVVSLSPEFLVRRAQVTVRISLLKLEDDQRQRLGCTTNPCRGYAVLIQSLGRHKDCACIADQARGRTAVNPCESS